MAVGEQILNRLERSETRSGSSGEKSRPLFAQSFENGFAGRTSNLEVRILDDPENIAERIEHGRYSNPLSHFLRSRARSRA